MEEMDDKEFQELYSIRSRVVDSSRRSLLETVLLKMATQIQLLENRIEELEDTVGWHNLWLGEK